MDNLILDLARLLGIDPLLLPIYLGILVAICNLIGKSIPESATGFLGLVRKVCKVVGLYVPNRITTTVSTATVAKAVAATAQDSTINAAANCLNNSVDTGVATTSLARELVFVGQDNSNASIAKKNRGPFAGEKVRSPALVGIASLAIMILLAGCTQPQKERVNNVVATFCTSAPLAQALYNAAVRSGDQNRINGFLNTVNTLCPGILLLIDTVPVRPVLPSPPPPPVPTPERG